MKFRLFILLLTASLLASVNNVNAAFVVKKSGTSETAKTAVAEPKTERASNRKELLNNLRAMKNLALHEGGNGKKGPRDTSGWEGIVALCCGILGLVTGWLAIPAIIFGALGMARGKQHRGLAVAGLVLGIVTLVLIMLFILLFAGYFGLWW